MIIDSLLGRGTSTSGARGLGRAAGRTVVVDGLVRPGARRYGRYG
ncbi:hypothetical protein [Oerskovia enterophila]